MYYLRTKSFVDAIKFTLKKEEKRQQAPAMAEATTVTATKAVNDKPLTAKELRNVMEQFKNTDENDEDCLMCGS
jgi:ribonucleoside-diphosphate reductase alpha chain